MQNEPKSEVKETAQPPTSPDEKKALTEEELAAVAAGRLMYRRDSQDLGPARMMK